MKIQYGKKICAYGGYNFVVSSLDKLGIGKILNANLPKLAEQCKYDWRDLLYSFWAVYFTRASAIEDVNLSLRAQFEGNPLFKVPSADRIIDRFKELAEDKKYFKSPRGDLSHEFAWSESLNHLLLDTLLTTGWEAPKDAILDYDNTIIQCAKADVKKTYKRIKGYQPGVATIDDVIVFLEQRNGNSGASIFQAKTLQRMFLLLEEKKIKTKRFRADSASYRWAVIDLVQKHVEYFYIRMMRNPATFRKLINRVPEWTASQDSDGTIVERASIEYTPFKKSMQEQGSTEAPKSYRLVITRDIVENGQTNIYTEDQYQYTAIITNDREMDNDQVVAFYNQRGKSEKHFDELKNDFGWKKLPFSKLQENYVFMIFTAICKNLYRHLITEYSKKHPHLHNTFRIKQFAFRIINTPAKWIKSGRQRILKLYTPRHLYHKLN